MIKKSLSALLIVVILSPYFGCKGKGDFIAQREINEDFFMPALQYQQMADYPLRHICYGESIGFVAVGDDGHILFSRDGLKWEHYKVSTSSLQRVCYNSDGFVAVGDAGTVLFSSDGKQWLPKNEGLTTANLKSVYASGKGFVAVGDSSTILYSEKGTVWSNVNKVANNHTLWDVFGSTLGFVAVGDSGTVKLSASGSNGWKSINIDSYKKIISATGNDTTFLIGGEDSTMLLLDRDGDITKPHIANVNETIQTVAVFKNLFLAGKSSGGFIYSTDGINWKQATTSIAQRHLNVNVIIPTLDYAVAIAYNKIYTSKDGKNWEGFSGEFDYSVSYIAASRDNLIAIGESGFLSRLESESMQWRDSSINPVTEYLQAIYGNEKGNVAVGRAGQILYSDNGMDWEVKEKGLINKDINAITGTETDFVAVGDSGTILYSGNGVNWEIKTAPLADQSLKAVAARANIFVATGDGPFPVYSTDGKKWNKSDSLPIKINNDIDQLVSNDKRFLVCSDDRKIFCSENGIRWDSVSLEKEKEVLIKWIWEAANRFYLITENSQIWSSNNGKNWEKEDELSFNAASSIEDIRVMNLKKGFVFSCTEYNDDMVEGIEPKQLFSAAGKKWDAELLQNFDEEYIYPSVVSITGRKMLAVNNKSIVEINDVEKYYPLLDSAKVEREGQDKVAVYLTLVNKDKPLNYDSLHLNFELHGVSERLQKMTNADFSVIDGPYSKPDSIRMPNTWKTTFKYEKLGLDPKIPDYSKFLLKLKVITDNTVQHFVLTDHSRKYFALTKTKFQQFFDKYGKWILLVLLYYFIILLFWRLSPITILFIHQKLPLKDILNKLPTPFNAILGVLGILFPISILAYGKRCLDAWVKKHYIDLKMDFEKVGTVIAKGGYVPLPVRVDNELNGELISTPTAEKILPMLVDGSRNIVQIVGPGGCGKTSFACEIGAWLLDKKNRRYTNGVQYIPYFLDKNNTDIISIISENYEAVLKKPVSSGLVAALLKKQRVILFIDALSEMKQETIDYFQNIYGKTQVNSLLVTGRNQFDFTRQDDTLLFPQPLNSSNLLFLISSILQKTEAQPLPKIEDQLAFAQKIAALLKSGDKELAVRPILVTRVMDNLIADYNENRYSTVSLLDRIPSSIPQVYFDYLRKVNPQTKTTDDYLSDRDMLKVAVIMGRLSLGESFVPQDFSVDETKDIIKKQLPHLNPENAIIRMKKNGIITEKNVLDEYSLRFSLDPLAEFTGAKSWADECGSREGINIFIEGVINQLDDNAKGFKQAFWLIVSPDSKYDRIFGWDQ